MPVKVSRFDLENKLNAPVTSGASGLIGLRSSVIKGEEGIDE